MKKELSQQEFLERYRKLPAELRDTIVAESTAAIVASISKRHGLQAEQMGDLAVEIGDLMVGSTQPKEFVPNLAERLRIPNDKAIKVANDVNKEVFGPVREHLRKLFNVSEFSVGDAKSIPTPSTFAKATVDKPTPLGDKSFNPPMIFPDKNTIKPTAPVAGSQPQHFQFKKPETALPAASIGATKPPIKPPAPPAPPQNKPFNAKPVMPSLSQFIPKKPTLPTIPSVGTPTSTKNNSNVGASTPMKPQIQAMPTSKNLVDPYREMPTPEEKSNMPATGPKPSMKDPKQPLPFSPDNARGLPQIGTPPTPPLTPKPLPSLIKPPSPPPPSSGETKIKKDPYRENMRD